MTSPLTFEHTHVPVFRVVRAAWPDPLETAHAMTRGGRWNPAGAFAVLYAACSERVARAVVIDVFRLAAVELDDLMPEAQPALVEIDWRGQVVDVASPEGVAAAGFAPDYPAGAGRDATQLTGVRWHDGRHECVAARSASLGRLGFARWEGEHAAWGELAVFVANARTQPRLLRLRRDLAWLTA